MWLSVACRSIPRLGREGRQQATTSGHGQQFGAGVLGSSVTSGDDIGRDDLATSLGFDFPGTCSDRTVGHDGILPLDIEPLHMKSLDLKVPTPKDYVPDILMSRGSTSNLLTSNEYRTMIAT